MSFKDLEQKHNLVNRVILACGKHPTDADINPLLEERLERFYEDAVIEGMAKQMHSSVDRAVNAMAKPWQGLTDVQLSEIYNDLYTQYTRDDVNIADFILIARTIQTKLKENA
jgi:hypothetical protein